jgi:hypothetical protein
MDKPKIIWWKTVKDDSAFDEKRPRIVLFHESDLLCCILHPDMHINFELGDGGGHGEGHDRCNGFSYEVWLNLLVEAKMIADFYWK